MKFDWPPIKVNKDRNELANNLGNPELAKNKEIYGVLSDPEFIKTFPGPADFQYDLIRESLISSKENAINGIAYLKDYIKTSDNPLFCLVRLSRFLHTALGNQKSLANNKEQKEISEILEKGFKDISSGDETKYFLGVNLNPDIILKQTQSFEGQERGLTPIHLSEGYFVQDNGFDPIPTFYHTNNPKEFNSITEEQKKFFESARPENRPEMSKNPSLKEMMAYKEKYLNSTINFSEIKKEIREKINNSTNKLQPEEIQKFFPTSHNTFELIQDPLMFEFRAFINPEVRSSIEKEFGVDLKGIPLKEQVYFLTSITNRTNKTIKPVQNFTKKFKGVGLRTFLSVEQGGKEMGDKILTLGEKLPEDVAKKVFTKYGEIIDNVSKITEFTRTNFTKEIETNPELIKKIEETLYIKGKQLLSQTYDDINNKKEVNYEDISKQLDRINADTITTFAIFKQAVKNGEKLPIESIEGSVFSKKEATDISNNQQNEMLELYESNWKNHPDRNFVESLKSYFKTAFVPEDNKQKNYFYTFEKDNNIRAFVRFEKQNDASFYASALNVDEASKNFGLGETMMDEALTREAKEHILHASCRKDNPSNMRYFEKGFVSRGFKKTNETEEFDLVWDENRNKDIKAKQKSQSELIGMYGNTNTEEIEIRKSKDLESLHEDIPEGKSLVRCFVNNGEWYAVYETIKEDYGMNLGETK